MANCPTGKSMWPELLGAKGDAAATVIERENRNVNAIVVREGSFVTQDLRCDRVRVWVNVSNVVVRVPRIG
ncbi:hypothetical protein ACP275_08G221900 [Erythranthe tilingii]